MTVTAQQAQAGNPSSAGGVPHVFFFFFLGGGGKQNDIFLQSCSIFLSVY